MTQHENNLKACELLEQIQDRAGDLWGACQMYTSDPIPGFMISGLQYILIKLNRYNEQMEK